MSGSAEATRNPSYISRVSVEKLFGEFDHDLHFESEVLTKPNLMILYGENGTGKTTLLWMLFHFLNRSDGEGHRTFLARQRFKKLQVEFTDGIQLTAQRESAGAGPFKMSMQKNGRLVASYDYMVDDQGAVPNLVQNKAHQKFRVQLPQFHFGFLPHDRMSTVKRRRAMPARVLHPVDFEQLHLPLQELSPIEESVLSALETAREQGIRASNVGQFTVNSIYTKLIERVAKVPRVRPAAIPAAREGLLNRISRQASEFRQFSEFGLTSALDTGGVEAALAQLPHSRFSIVAQVLEPWLSGNDARLEALKPLHIALFTFVTTLNSLYLNKKVSLHLESGLTITTTNGDRLSPNLLSSGEKELLVLFCEVISALRPNTILFIDEPELSLNVTWQERLIDSLLRCASGSNVQFVIATHSIEMLAHYRSNVVRLSTKLVGTPTRVVAQGGRAG